MKQMNIRILSIALIIVIITASFLSYSVPVYASHGGGGTSDKDHNGPTNAVGKLDWDEMSDSRKWVTICEYVVAQVRAYAGGDFVKYLEAQDAFKEYVYGKTPDDIVTVTDEGMTIPADLVALIKQALIEYADETNPFFLVNTYRARDIPASTFPTKTIYNTFLAYATSHNVSAFQTYTGNYGNGFLRLGDVTPLLKEGGAFVSKNTNFCTCYTVNGDWSSERIIYDNYDFNYTADSPKSQVITEVKEGQGYFEGFTYYVAGLTSFQSPYGSIGYLVSPDGGRIRVFKSLTEFMGYDAGQRKVYFGSGFYDFDPTDITATWDEINDKIGRMDDILQDILDAITDNPNLSEEDLEKLIDELIGKIGEIGGELGDKTDQTNTILGGISSTLSGIASSLSGYFSSVLSYLSGLVGTVREGFMTLSEKMDMMIYELGLIYESMGDMTEEEVSEKTDSLLSQLFSAFSEIGDVLKGKFPFCLPNDLYTMLALLAGNEVSVSPGAGGGGGDIMICAYGAADEDSKAPVFEIPFVIGSADIEEKIIIDLSPFEYISKLSRTLMTLYYCACLMQLTLKVIDLGKDLGDD